jgi:hypothetical protein
MRNLWNIMAIMAAAAGLAQAGTMVDTFENGIVEDSDSEVGFWVVSGSYAYAINETNGQLELKTAHCGPSESKFIQLGTASANAAWDFFSGPITFSADVTSQEGTAEPGDCEFRFCVYSEPGFGFQADDYFQILIQQDNTVYVQQKKNGTSITLQKIDPGNTVAHFDLTLDASEYSLDLTDTNGEVSNHTGSHDLAASDWNATGACAAFITVKNEGSAGHTQVTIDNFDVKQGTKTP